MEKTPGRIAASLFGYCFIVFVAGVFVHESAHFIAALLIGVPFSEIEVGLIRGNPGVTIPERFSNNPSLSLLHYAGGFSTALVLLSLYIFVWLRRYRNHATFTAWACGVFTALAIGMEISQGYLEGRFHAAYIFYAGSMFGATSLFQYAIVAVIVGFHLLFFPVKRQRKWILG